MDSVPAKRVDIICAHCGGKVEPRVMSDFRHGFMRSFHCDGCGRHATGPCGREEETLAHFRRVEEATAKPEEEDSIRLGVGEGLKGLPMENCVPCYMVRVMVAPNVFGRSYLETYFIAKSDQDAVKDSLSHVLALGEVYGIHVDKLEVSACHLGPMVEGVYQGGIDRLLYDSDNLDESIVKERTDFIG